MTEGSEKLAGRLRRRMRIAQSHRGLNDLVFRTGTLQRSNCSEPSVHKTQPRNSLHEPG